VQITFQGTRAGLRRTHKQIRAGTLVNVRPKSKYMALFLKKICDFLFTETYFFFVGIR
jgi:hypothetical protein